MNSWNEEFIKSFKDFQSFAKWDGGRTPDAELKSVWAKVNPAKEEPQQEVKKSDNGNGMTSNPPVTTLS